MDGGLVYWSVVTIGLSFSDIYNTTYSLVLVIIFLFYVPLHLKQSLGAMGVHRYQEVSMQKQRIADTSYLNKARSQRIKEMKKE